MPSKKPLTLPGIIGASPRGEPASAGHGARRESIPRSGRRQKADYPRKEQQDRFTAAHQLDLEPDSPTVLQAPEATADDMDPEVQDVQDIIQEVRKLVHTQKPWRGEYDEAVLERRAISERQEFYDRSFHIILPDNRVRAVEDRLSRRIRAQLLGEPEPSADQAGTLRFAESGLHSPRRAQARPRAPWYLPAHSWYNRSSSKDVLGADGRRSSELPYYTQIARVEARPGTLADEQIWQDAMKRAADGDTNEG
mmetsp:Transcript_7362/g.16108  ORF Transcript_7362/g.16108 Transcript_7362/m.16108 type:complete len:252 (-) Transcript_7362:77-832(-)